MTWLVEDWYDCLQLLPAVLGQLWRCSAMFCVEVASMLISCLRCCCCQRTILATANDVVTISPVLW